MILNEFPNNDLLETIFDKFIDTHYGNLLFFCHKESLTYKDTYLYAKEAINFVYSYYFDKSEIKGSGDISIYYSIKNLYQEVSISFINKILNHVFNESFDNVTDLTKKKSDLPIMYINGDNPFDISKEVYVYKSQLHSIVIDFVLYYIHNTGITLKEI